MAKNKSTQRPLKRKSLSALTRGVASVADPFGMLSTYRERASDTELIRSDWRAIGGDMWQAMEKYNKPTR
jgi:hypothetical protein